MSTISTRFSTVAQVLPSNLAASPSSELSARLSSLYLSSQRSNYVFGSPLGPFYHRGQALHVPRFVYFGPHTHDESLRLAFFSGFDASDLRGSLALLNFVEGLASAPDLGQGLNLSFFPIVDVVGLFQGLENRDLANASWSFPSAPEIDLLQKDARSRGYHGFVRIETGSSEDAITVRVQGDCAETAEASGIELISSEDLEPSSVRWEAKRAGDEKTGPLALIDDLPLRPFELILSLPSDWTEERSREAVTTTLKRFILRYRTLQAYGQHL